MLFVFHVELNTGERKTITIENRKLSFAEEELRKQYDIREIIAYLEI